MANEFLAAIQKARLRVAQIESEQQRLAQEKAQLLKSIEALAPLLTEQPTREALTLADSMRTVMAGYEMNHPNTLFTPKLVRELLTQMSFDFSDYNANHLAGIHTAMRRMCKAGELEPAGDLDFGGGYKWIVPDPIKQLAKGAKFSKFYGTK
jgi:hypothetical protein